MTTDRKHILVAEDNPALAAVLRFNLQRAGYEATVARNGQEALQLAKKSSFDLVVTDHQMPLLTGTELCEQLRELDRYRETPILMLTAKALELRSDYVLNELNVVDLISKPFSPSAIVEIIDQQFISVS